MHKVATAVDEITLDSVGGLYGTDSIRAGAAVTFYLGIEIGDDDIYGISNGFRVYSADGTNWDTLTASWTGTISDSVYNYQVVTRRDGDGIPPDTIGLTGIGIQEPLYPLPSGFNETVWAISIGQVSAQFASKTVCIDSSFFPPYNVWKWQADPMDEPIVPLWEGPYCFTVVDAGCCTIRGDINHDGVGPAIDDLVYLSTYMFNGGDAPPCMDEADVNGDGVPADISDMVYLNSYMFSGGPAPVACD